MNAYHFTAVCQSVSAAREFAAEAERTCGASNIARVGKVVEFDSVMGDCDDFAGFYGDTLMSVRYYGGDRAKLTATKIVDDAPAAAPSFETSVFAPVEPAKPMPTGPTQNTWFASGYQAALADIATALKQGGESAARTWLDNNLRSGVAR